mgnify:CR=1 FL=1
MDSNRKEYTTINGELMVHSEGNIVFAEFHRAIDQKIVTHFMRAIEDIGGGYNGQKWVYISNSLGIDAATPDSEAMLVKAVLLAQKLGCVGGAYVATSMVAIGQMDRVLKLAGVPTGIQGRVFENVEQAKAFLMPFLD